MDALIAAGFAHGGGLHNASDLYQAQMHNDPHSQQQQGLDYLHDQNYGQAGEEYQAGEQSPMEGDTGSEDDGVGEDPNKALNYKCKPRRKATQKPVGSDQKRQAFSKRKRGIVLKAYQLYKLTDAKVFMFMVNDKGSSWAYASPSFGSSLHPSQLRRLRELAGHTNPSKHSTEVMAHPRMDEADRLIDDRHTFVGALEPLQIKNERGALHRDDPTVVAARAASARDRDAQRNMLRIRSGAAGASPGSNLVSSRDNALVPAGAPSSNATTDHMRNLMPGSMAPGNRMMDDGYGGDSIITPSGHALAKAVGLGHLMPQTANVDAQEGSGSGSGGSEQQTNPVPLPPPAPAFTGQIITDAQGNMYRIIQEAAPPSMASSAPTQNSYVMPPGAMDSLPLNMMSSHHLMQMQQTSAGNSQQPSTAQQAQQAQAAVQMAATAQHQAQQAAAARFSEDQEAGAASGLATLAAAAAAANGGSAGNSNNSTTTTTSAGRLMGHDPSQQQPGVMQMPGALGLDGPAGNGSMVVAPPGDGSGGYMQAGSSRMTTYMQPHYGHPNPHHYQQQMGGGTQMMGTNHQHMSGYSMAPQDMQGYRQMQAPGYPPGSVVMLSSDWGQGMGQNMGQNNMGANPGNAPRPQGEQWR